MAKKQKQIKVEVNISCPCGQEIEDELDIDSSAPDAQIAKEIKQWAIDKMGQWGHSWRKVGEEEWRHDT